MDIYCPKRGCAEPFDNDSLHDAVEDSLFPDYTAALHTFQSKGCEALGFTHSTGNDSGRAEVMDAMFDLMGDDMDGAAAMMEDYDYMFE
jgi:hypothetical protein